MEVAAAAKPTEDLDPTTDTANMNGNESSDSDSEEDEYTIGALRPDIETDADSTFSLDLMKTLNHGLPNIEALRKYSELLFGSSTGLTQCEHCDFSSDNLLELRFHQSKAHDGVQVHCMQCEYTAARRDTLINHVRKVHEGKGFPCDKCDYVAGTRQHLDRHKAGVHDGIRRDPNTRRDGENVLWPCDFCDYKTKRRYELKLHFAADHEGRRFACDFCNFTAKRKDKLNLHVRVVHEGLGKKCKYCDYKAATNQHLLRHMRSKHSDMEGAPEMLKCLYCEEEFSRQEKLNEHCSRVHATVQTETNGSPNAFTHIRELSGQQCNECDFTAPTKSKLNEHYKIAHGGRKYKCDQCNFECLTHGGLYLHQKAVHLGIRFKCDQCNYEGTQEVNLKRHIESKHGTVLYCCTLCNVRTKGLWYFETHLRKKHGVTDKEKYSQYLELKDIDPEARWHMNSYKTSPEVLDHSKNYSVEGDFNDSEDCSMDDSFDPSALLDQTVLQSYDEDQQSDHHGSENSNNFLEPTVEIESGDEEVEIDYGGEDEEDSQNIPDLELFEPSVCINSDDADDKSFLANNSFSQVPEDSVQLKHKNPKLVCKKCGFVANSSGTLTRHVSVVHRGVRWSCKLCGYVTTVKCSMVRHIQSIHQGWRYHCPFCDHEATQKGGLKYHIEKKHSNNHPIPKWSSLSPVKSKENSQIPGIENMDVNEMFDEICDPFPDTAVGESLFDDYRNESASPKAEATAMQENEESSFLEPSVEIIENCDEKQFSDGAEEGGAAAVQYVGEDHDFTELYARFNTNGEEEVQCDLCTYVTSRLGNMRRHVLAVHQETNQHQCSFITLSQLFNSQLRQLALEYKALEAPVFATLFYY